MIFSSFSFYVCNDWLDLYIDESKKNEFIQSRYEISPTKNVIAVLSCAFHNISMPSGPGAAICFQTNNDAQILFLDKVFFTYCNVEESNANGGAVYLNNKGQCIFSSVCSVFCTTNNAEGQFAYLTITDNIKYKCCISQSSIVRSQNEKSFVPLYVDNGNHSFEHCNISENLALRRSGIAALPISSNDYTFHILSCNFHNNTSLDNECIWLRTPGSNHLIYLTNIINNKQYGTDYGVITLYDGILSFEKCSIYDNFNNDKGKVFYLLHDGKFNFVDTYVSNDDEESSHGTLNFENRVSVFKNENTYDTHQCLADNKKSFM